MNLSPCTVNKVVKSLLFLLIIMMCFSAQATHIVGGVIYYTHLGGTSYRVTMKIYRDCTSSTGFDSPAEIGLFDEITNAQVATYTISSPVITRINPVITNPCMTTVPICVEEGVYTTTINVPNTGRAYYLSYVRCCRNGSINNLVTPGSVGATYSVRIPSTTPYANSNPVYSNFPPIFICQNSPLIFNHAAVDINGDSLFYELCPPNQGGSTTAPAPGPLPGPYTPVTFRSPYSSLDPMGSTPPPAVALNIDPNTGLLTGTPPTTGQFVVGVCVSEYRGGVLLSRTLRDFQFNVVNCPIPVANIPSTNINPVTGVGDFIRNCTDFTVNFRQTSSGATGYRWDFGVPSTSADTSNLASPTFVYPDTGTYLVTLVARNAVGCIDTTSAYVYIYPLFIPDFTFKNTCVDTAIQFTDITTSPYSNPISWNWNFGDGTSSTLRNPLKTYTAAGTYTVSLRVRSDKNCDKTISKNVIVHPIPTPNFRVDSACIGRAIGLVNTSTGAVGTYLWNFGDSTASTLRNPIKTYIDTGVYTISLTIRTDSGCTQRISRSIRVNPLPIVGINRDTTICAGSSIQLIASGGVSYVWTPATGLSNSRISNPIASPIAPTTYSVRVADANRCQNSNSVNLSLYTNSPEFSFTNECRDTAVQFNDSSSTTGGLITQWSWTFGDGNTSTLQNPTHLYSVAGSYNVKLSFISSLGCRDSITQRVIIHEIPVPDFRFDSTCIFAPVLFTYTGTVAPTIVYNAWDFGDGSALISGTPVNHTYTSAGLYTVRHTVRSDSNCTQFVEKPVTVNPLPIIITSNDTFLCPGFSAPINASGGILFQWSPGATLSDSFISNPIASPLNIRTVYTVRVADANRCQNSDSVVIDFFRLFPVDAGMDTSVCLAPGSFRDSAQLNASGGVSYSWSPNYALSNTNIQRPFAAPDTNTMYFVDVTDSNGCVQRDSVKVVVLDPQIDIITTVDTGLCFKDTIQVNVADQGLISLYSWTPTAGLDLPNSRSPRFSPADTTLYVIYVQNYCYSKRDSLLVNVYPLPSTNTGGLDSICLGDTLQILASGATFYTWDPNPTLTPWNVANPIAFPRTSTTYYLTGIDTLGCRNRDSMRVLVYLKPNARILSPPNIICLGTPVMLQVVGGTKFLWSYGWTMNDSTISNPLVSAPDTMDYWVQIFNDHDCFIYDTVRLNVQKPVSAYAWPDTAICIGDRIWLRAEGGKYYSWSPDSLVEQPNASRTFAIPPSTMNYTVRVSNDCFSDDTSVNVLVRPLPIADAGRDTTIFRDQSTILQGSGGISYIWIPNTALNDGNIANPVASPQNTIRYFVIVTDPFGCQQTDSVLVKVEGNSVILLPTAFSPNGDGVNDFFKIVKYLNIEDLVDLSVYNRWGEKVFSTNLLDGEWDGVYKGREQPMSTFAWTLQAVDKDGKIIVKSGTVTLLR